MCAGFEVQYTFVDINLHQIIAYQIGSVLNHVDNRLNLSGDSDVPTINYVGGTDNGMDAVEDQIIKCMRDFRGGPFKAALNKAADATYSEVFTERPIYVHQADDFCTAPDGSPRAGCWDPQKRINPPANGSPHAEITISRKMVMADAVQMEGNGTTAARIANQQKLYIKRYAEVFVHEMCHDYLWPATHDENQVVNLPYYSTPFGQCEFDGYVQTLGEHPPSYKSVAGEAQTYTFSRACLTDVWNNNQRFFKSVRSQHAAHTQYPYPTKWHTEVNPHA